MRRTIALAITAIMVCAAVLCRGEFWGSKRSDKYHLPSCEWAQGMSPSNKSVFASVDNERESIIDIGALVGVKPGMKFAVLCATPLEVRDRDSKAVLDVVDREKLRQIVVASSKIFESPRRPFESPGAPTFQ